MTIIRIGAPLRNFLLGVEPDPKEDPDLVELIDLLEGHPTYPAGIELDEKYWSDVYYFAGLLLELEPTAGESRSCNAALNDLRQAGYQP